MSEEQLDYSREKVPLLAWAKVYLKTLGLSVIPLKEKEKIPLVKWKEYTIRKATEEELEQWFANNNLNIGCVCGEVSGNLVVLDFDDESVFEKFFPKGKELAQQTLAVKTARGVHIYLRTNKPMQSRRYDEIHLDVKGEGSVVTLPPSIHPSGQVYKFYGGGRLGILKIDDDLEQLIEKQLEKFKIRVSRKSESVSDKEIEDAMRNGVGEGQRWEWRSHIYFYLRRKRYPEDDIKRAIYRFNEICNPPDKITEVDRQLNWLIKNFPPINVDSIYDEDGKVIPSRIASLFIKEKNGFVITTGGKDKTTFVFTGTVWKNAENEIINFIKQLIGDRYTRRIRDETIANIEAETIDINKTFTRPPLHLIPLKNGVYDLKRKMLIDYEPDMFFRDEDVLPVVYNKDATCPEISRFLSEVVSPDNRIILEEFIGYCLYRDYHIQKALLIVGEGANGKSCFLEMLTRFLGKKNVVGRTMQEIESNRFAAANLEGKLANIFADLPSKTLKTTSMFKALTGGDFITVERKYGREPASFVNHAKLIFSANRLPEVYEDTEALFRRFIIIPFPNTFIGDKADPKKIDKITTQEELSGLLNIALQRLYELLERGSFSYSKDIESIRAEYIRQSNPIAYFVEKCITPDPQGFVVKTDLYHEYINFARENNLYVMSEDAFVRKFVRSCKYPIKPERRRILGERVRGFAGISLNTQM